MWYRRGPFATKNHQSYGLPLFGPPLAHLQIHVRTKGCGGPPLVGVEQQQQQQQQAEEGGEGVFAYVFGGSDADGNASNDLW